jgi:hypothetical protein
VNSEIVQASLLGSWRLMMGRTDGLRLLDLSVDGFWNSFFAIVLSVPPLAVGWISIANEMVAALDAPMRSGIIARLAFVDLGAWLVPLVALAVVAKPAGLASRFVPYVVASNWGSAIVAWIMLPAALTRLIYPDAVEAAALVSLILFGISLVLTWRLTNSAIGRGPGIATAVFAGMFLGSVVVLLMLQGAVGIPG